MDDLQFITTQRYLSVLGSYIDTIGSQPHPLVQQHHISNRIARDGCESQHITFINHLQLESLFPTPTDPELSKKGRKKLVSQFKKDMHCSILSQFGLASTWTKPMDLGLGKVEKDDAVSYFRVLHWPFGQTIRRSVGLGHTHFHITVGFEPHDVHIYKGPRSLLCLSAQYHCTKQEMNTLLSVAEYYYEDSEFVKMMLKTCMRHGFYRNAVELVYSYIKSYTKNRYLDYQFSAIAT